MNGQVIVLVDESDFKRWVVEKIIETQTEIKEIKALLVEQGEMQAKIDILTDQIRFNTVKMEEEKS